MGRDELFHHQAREGGKWGVFMVIWKEQWVKMGRHGSGSGSGSASQIEILSAGRCLAALALFELQRAIHGADRVYSC